MDPKVIHENGDLLMLVLNRKIVEVGVELLNVDGLGEDPVMLDTLLL